jgi:hypothetical protein
MALSGFFRKAGGNYPDRSNPVVGCGCANQLIWHEI